jgi:alkylation response protein AidB-like acyl-CoA dehydrogenase
LERLLPADVSVRIDQQGSTLCRDKNGKLAVSRHPELDVALAELSRLGLFRIFVPREVGGFGLPVAIYYMAVQLISYFDTSLALLMLVHGNAMYIINRYGTPEQRLRYLPSMAKGERLATVAFTEPGAGSDAGKIRTRAEVDGETYVLHGNKLFITNGGDADLLVTTARTGPLEQGIHGVSTFILEREADGVEILGLEDKTALNGSPTAALSYTDLRIPKDRLLGRLNHGGEVMFAGVGMTRVNIGAQALGIAKRAFDAAVEFAREREQGGQVILEHDAIQQRLAQMTLMISAMENMICWVSGLENLGQWHVREMSITKYFCSEALQLLTQRAINIFGGYGVSRGYAVERCRREATALPLYGGTSEIQWLIIAREYLDSLAGRSHFDYKTRDRELVQKLEAGCPEARSDLVTRLANINEILWELCSDVSQFKDPVPYYRHLTDLATSFSVAQTLLWQAIFDSSEDYMARLEWESERTQIHCEEASRVERGSARPPDDNLCRDTIEWQLAVMAMDQLEDQERISSSRIKKRVDRGALKANIRKWLSLD